MKLLVLFSSLSLAALHAQAVVEAGLGAGKAATMTAPAKDLGKSIAGALGGLDKTLNSTKSSVETISVTGGAPAPPSAPPKLYEDIKKAEVGIAYEALIERFGPASLQTAGEDGIKRLTYSGKEGNTRIEVKDGKVSSITAVKQQSSVLVLPR
ncbi:MAG TPA: hypothetical protein VMJ75_20685 [Candidatus Acidoferrales bacterium]|nr:hypothetical protein [Candidatus Acidoferrales bacterium]HXK03273.1 hypothetical protein [Verrucomicrobiae bacterium]